MDDIVYSVGPRFVNGKNIDKDVDASIPIITEVDIKEPVTDSFGRGYEPGQKNNDGTSL